MIPALRAGPIGPRAGHYAVRVARSEAKDPIVWIDCEMTGLSLTSDALVEIAVIVTDSELNPVDEGIDLVIAPPPGALEQMGDVVRKMHTVSGLLEELPAGTTLADASERVLSYVRELVPEAGRAPLAGNSVGTDKAFLERDIPELVAHLHYRLIDVSSIKELARRWYPRAYFQAPKKSGGHRALGDIRDSIDELRYYRAVLFPEGAGPDSATAREVAEQITASSASARPGPTASEIAL